MNKLFEMIVVLLNINCIEFITRALGNFFSIDQLEEFYEFLKDE